MRGWGLRRHGSHYFVANLYSNVAYRAIAERRYGEAERSLDEALGLLDSSYAHLTAIVHGNLGLARLLAGRPSEAAPAFLDALRFAGEQINATCAAEGLAGLAAVAAAAGDHRRCARLLGAARRLGTFADASITAELERCFYAPSRLALGERAWEDQAGRRRTLARRGCRRGHARAAARVRLTCLLAQVAWVGQ